MDKRFHFSDAPAQFAGARLVRHGDDFVILARDLGTGIPDWVEAIVAGWRGLTPNREKTRTVRLKEDGAVWIFWASPSATSATSSGVTSGSGTGSRAPRHGPESGTRSVVSSTHGHRWCRDQS